MPNSNSSDKLKRMERTLKRLAEKKPGSNFRGELQKTKLRDTPEYLSTNLGIHDHPSTTLTKTEQSLLQAWRQLSPEQQQLLLALTNQLRLGK